MPASPSINPSTSGSGASLFASQIVKFIIIGLGLVFSIYIAVQITDPDVNGLAAFMRYAAAGCFAFAVVSPRAGIYLVLFTCPVLDMIKRMLILFDNVSMIDVATVLPWRRLPFSARWWGCSLRGSSSGGRRRSMASAPFSWS